MMSGVRQLPTGTVTFLFTDIEGSTRLLGEHGEAYAGLLEEHRRVLRAAFERHGGIEVDTQGDAFFVAFSRASDALAAAEQAQGRLELPVRMGIHTGEPTVTHEGYIGMDVHRAARICAAGHGGQILVSEATQQLVEGAPLHDLGEHRLKDLGQPVRLYQLGEREFPRLRSLNQTNLPAQPSELVGRERELAELVELLGERRLLTLTGPGGSGKTRLSLQVAAEAVERFAGGVFFVPLAAVSDPELVLPTVGQTIGAQDGVAEHVGEHEMLLLLDNLEHVLDAAPALAELLERSPNLRLLITSRALLRIAGEHEYPVEPLPEEDAVALFQARAADSEPLAAVHAICRRLDGLPLAVELAASRTRLLSPEQLLERLEHALPVLTSGRRDAPERQRTLRATIEWSYQLLDPAAQQLLRRLSVFAGSFTIEAAEEVCDANLDTLESLLDHSLVRRWASSRLGMLETIREFAAELLDKSGEGDSLEQRRYDYLLALAPADPGIEGVAPESVERLGAELHDYRGALAWSLEANPRGCLELAIALGRFWVIRDRTEGERWLMDALSATPEPSPRLRAEALMWAASCRSFTRDYASVAMMLEESLALFRELGDTSRMAAALDRLSGAQLNLGQLEEAKASAEESLALCEQLGDRRHTMYALSKLAFIARNEGKPLEARETHERVVALAREFGDSWWASVSLLALAYWALEDGEVERAAELCRESTTLAAELGDHFHLLESFALLAAIAAKRGNAAAAGRFWGALEALEREGHAIDPDSRERYADLVRNAEGAEFAAAIESMHRLEPDDAVKLALESLH